MPYGRSGRPSRWGKRGSGMNVFNPGVAALALTSALRLPPSPEEVRAELERILSSPEFSVPARACAFLRYVVEETLSGRATRLKGYSIAIEVFDRDENFTQDDPVVRIEAGRLRRALERYYLLSGCTDRHNGCRLAHHTTCRLCGLDRMTETGSELGLSVALIGEKRREPSGIGAILVMAMSRLGRPADFPDQNEMAATPCRHR